MTNSETPYSQGYNAPFDGSTNPYGSRTSEWLAWEEGYLASMNDNFVDWFEGDAKCY